MTSVERRVEVPIYELHGFGLALGQMQAEKERPKLHIFADLQTADFILSAMRCQIGKPTPHESIIFPKMVKAHGPYCEDACVAELRRGKRIVEALGQDAVRANSPQATARLLGQMSDMARELAPFVGDRLEQQQSGLYAEVLQKPLVLWSSPQAHNALSYRGVTPELPVQLSL